MTTEAKVSCPKCGSEQIHADKRGWHPLWGVIGMNSLRLTCLKCAHKFKPGATPESENARFENPLRRAFK